MDFSDIEILNNICKTKYKRMQKLGISLGYDVPNKREQEIIKPSILKQKDGPMIIAEIKRASPTQGNISQIENPIDLAGKYISQGADAISVLCEEDYFKGSLLDLYNIKQRFGHICILRKDFILEKEEIKTSYLFGADMILLIVSIFKNNIKAFYEIYQEILRYNLTALIEIHDEEELSLITDINLSNAIIGINSRNLKTFHINKANAIKLRAKIPEHIPVIFESGLDTEYEAYMVGNGGFQGLLCGSSLVRNMESNLGNKNKLQDIKDAFTNGIKSNKFFANVCRRFYINNKNTLQKPLIKICGINDLEFMRAAIPYADLLGFILTKDSKRYVDKDFCNKANEILQQNLNNSSVPLKVGIVTQHCLDIGLSLLENNILDALQLHNFPIEFFNPESVNCNVKYGDLSIDNMSNWQFTFYPSLNHNNMLSMMNSDDYNRFFALYDNSAGKGLPINMHAILQNDSIESNNNLWLAGGISIENIQEILQIHPMLIDINSGLESSEAVKSIDKLHNFMRYLNDNNT